MRVIVLLAAAATLGPAATADAQFTTPLPFGWDDGPAATPAASLGRGGFTPVEVDVEPADAASAGAAAVPTATVITSEYDRVDAAAGQVGNPAGQTVGFDRYADKIGFEDAGFEPLGQPESEPAAAGTASLGRVDPVSFAVPLPATAAAAATGIACVPDGCDNGACRVGSGCHDCDSSSYAGKLGHWLSSQGSKWLGKKRKAERDLEYVFEYPAVMPSGCPYGYFEPRWSAFCNIPCPPPAPETRIFDRAEQFRPTSYSGPPAPMPTPAAPSGL